MQDPSLGEGYNNYLDSGRTYVTKFLDKYAGYEFNEI
jgi:hypothetical protein